jgi:hypothetical protein
MAQDGPGVTAIAARRHVFSLPFFAALAGHLLGNQHYLINPAEWPAAKRHGS